MAVNALRIRTLDHGAAILLGDYAIGWSWRELSQPRVALGKNARTLKLEPYKGEAQLLDPLMGPWEQIYPIIAATERSPRMAQLLNSYIQLVSTTVEWQQSASALMLTYRSASHRLVLKLVLPDGARFERLGSVSGFRFTGLTKPLEAAIALTALSQSSQAAGIVSFPFDADYPDLDRHLEISDQAVHRLRTLVAPIKQR